MRASAVQAMHHFAVLAVRAVLLNRTCRVWNYRGRFGNCGGYSLQAVSIKAERPRFIVSSLRRKTFPIKYELDGADITCPNQDMAVRLN